MTTSSRQVDIPWFAPRGGTSSLAGSCIYALPVTGLLVLGTWNLIEVRLSAASALAALHRELPHVYGTVSGWAPWVDATWTGASLLLVLAIALLRFRSVFALALVAGMVVCCIAVVLFFETMSASYCSGCDGGLWDGMSDEVQRAGWFYLGSVVWSFGGLLWLYNTWRRHRDFG